MKQTALLWLGNGNHFIWTGYSSQFAFVFCWLFYPTWCAGSCPWTAGFSLELSLIIEMERQGESSCPAGLHRAWGWNRSAVLEVSPTEPEMTCLWKSCPWRSLKQTSLNTPGMSNPPCAFSDVTSSVSILLKLEQIASNWLELVEFPQFGPLKLFIQSQLLRTAFHPMCFLVLPADHISSNKCCTESNQNFTNNRLIQRGSSYVPMILETWQEPTSCDPSYLFPVCSMKQVAVWWWRHLWMLQSWTG